MAVALVKQQKGTAYLREMTHSWCRNNFSCREDTLRPGRVHVLTPGATERGWVVLHMALMVPIGSQHHLRTSPTHLLLRDCKKSRSPCWFHFLLHICKHRAPQKNPNSSWLSWSQSLNCSRHSCMFHTHCMITFVLHRKRKERARANICSCCAGADFLWDEESFNWEI